MNCDNPLPRVGFAQLKNYINKKVLFVGKIESINNNLVNMQAPDGSKVVVQANSHYDTPFAEVTGVVMDPMTIREESHVSFGENFDMNLYNEFLKLATGPHIELFQPRGF